MTAPGGSAATDGGRGRRRVVAVIVAAETTGSSGAAVRALLAPLAGRPVIEHSVAAFEQAPSVEEILVVVPAALTEQVRRRLAAGGYRKVSRVIDGGATRAESVRRALGALGDADAGVLIHDAARPLLSQRVIAGCVTALSSHDAVCAVVPAADTMVAVENEFITERPQRDRLRRRQTPQGFRLAVIRRGHELARADPAFEPADDCAVVLRYLPEVTVQLVPGSELSFPVTSPADLDIAETLLAAGLP